jgi:hypothetical protein
VDGGVAHAAGCTVGIVSVMPELEPGFSRRLPQTSPWYSITGTFVSALAKTSFMHSRPTSQGTLLQPLFQAHATEFASR